MQELIKVSQNEKNQSVVSARDLHHSLEVQKHFSQWIEPKLERFVSGEDFLTFELESTGGRPSTDYVLTLDCAKMIAMLQNNEVGDKVRKYFIECERQLQVPKALSRKDILLLALESEERALLAEAKVIEQTPKVEAFDRVLDGSTTYTLDTVSDILNIGRTKLSAKLKSIGWSMKDSTFGTASTRKAEEAGNAKTYFENITLGNKEVKVKKIVITKKGLDYLVNNYSSIFE